MGMYNTIHVIVGTAVKRFNDSFGELEDEDHRYEVWTDIESGDKVMKEVTIEDGERVVLSEETIS